MSTHTPGPWITFESDGVYAVLPAGRRGQIAVDLTLADANLIAAAPEMLKALKEAVSDVDEICTSALVISTTSLVKMRAAIARAEDNASAYGKGEAT